MKFLTSLGEMEVAIEHCYVAGWTGRNKEAVEHHIQELAAIGISPPSTVPLYYRVSSSLLTQDSRIQVLGDSTSGEVEPFVLQSDGQLWIGLASDHTDRELEAHSVAASKQACPKPVARELWKFDDVENHLDSLILRCRIEENDQWVSYQEGNLSEILPVSQLLGGAALAENSAMLCGTLGANGGVRAASCYRMALEDPVRKTQITLEYASVSLPVVE